MNPTNWHPDECSSRNRKFALFCKRIQRNAISGGGALNSLNPIGFIILSSVDRTIPILGYSYHSEIDINELPRQLEAVLISYQEGIQYVMDKNIMQDDKTIYNFRNF